MKKLFILPFLIVLLFAVSGCSSTANENSNQATINSQTAEVNNASQKSASSLSDAEFTADKLEVYYFHRTARCYSCKTIGQYVRDTIEQKYGELVKNGKIDFQEINVELPENKEIAQKYQASGSSLYINRIKDGQDNIEQDTNVWRLITDENEFKNYLENKINSYLGI